MPKNKNLHKAKKEKNDEFYTQLIDIQKEMMHYTHHFSHKTIYCNADSPNSQFVHFFKENFHTLKLKKLIATSYNPNGKGTYLEYDGKTLHISNLIENGDFQSQECYNLLQEADIVITNPPFSLFKEFVQQVQNANKEFLIIGTWNAISYKEIFTLIAQNKLWMGVNRNRDFSGFVIPEHYTLHGTEARIDESGNRIVSSNNTCWFTNLTHSKRNQILTLTKTYNPIDYPHYDNYDGINVDKTKDIPKDYKGHIGVPITFLDKYNPNQFQIIQFRKGNDHKDLKVNGKCPYFRIIIKPL